MKHWQAIEADLIPMGLRLRDVGTEQFTWEDLRAILQLLQTRPDSMLAREVYGADIVGWDMQAQLLAAVFDATQLTNWYLRLLGGDKSAEGNPPDPLPRPGIKSTTVQWAGKPVTIEEMDRMLGWRQN